MKTYSILFHKMHGLGNDFIIINGIYQKIPLDDIPISKLAHRHLGIGFDQLIFIDTSKHADFACRFFNADGSEAEQCGNGVRCVARFVYENNLINKKHFVLETKGGLVSVTIQSQGYVEAEINIPQFELANISCLGDTFVNEHKIEINKTIISISTLSLGNPHAILRVPVLEKVPVPKWGAKIAKNPLFPESANIGFMEVLNHQTIRLRTYERGVGETFACGSNACAAVLVGIANKWLDSNVTVKLKWGDLLIEWIRGSDRVKITGATEWVFSGETWV